MFCLVILIFFSTFFFSPSRFIIIFLSYTVESVLYQISYIILIISIQDCTLLSKDYILCVPQFWSIALKLFLCYIVIFTMIWSSSDVYHRASPGFFVCALLSGHCLQEFSLWNCRAHQFVVSQGSLSSFARYLMSWKLSFKMRG